MSTPIIEPGTGGSYRHLIRGRVFLLRREMQLIAEGLIIIIIIIIIIALAISNRET